MKAKITLLGFILLSVHTFAAVEQLPQMSAERTDTLHVIISKSNRIYYYFNSMNIDASNFNVTKTQELKLIISSKLEESKKQNDELLILLKFQGKDAVSEEINAAISYIRQQKYKQVAIDPVEDKLIEATEK